MFKLSVRSWPTLVVWVKNDTPLALVFSLAGCSSFQQSSPLQLQQVTTGTNRTFDLYDQLRDDGEEIVRSRWPIDTDRRQSELP